MSIADETTEILKKKRCPEPQRKCNYDEHAIKRWVETKMKEDGQSELQFWMKLLGTILPFVIGFVVWVNGINSQVQEIKIRQDVIFEIKEDLKVISKEIVSLRIDLEKIKNKLQETE